MSNCGGRRFGGGPSSPSRVPGYHQRPTSSGFAGLLVGVLTLRLRHDYLAITTFGIAVTIQLVATNAQALTGGTFGIQFIPKPLQAAFGKARYFMRTLPVPVRLDPARRLQGDRSEAASAQWAWVPLPERSRAAALRLLGRLDDGAGADASARAAWVPELVALDRSNPEWVAVCQQMLSDEGVAVAARALRARLLADSPVWASLPLSRGTIEAAAPTPQGPR